MTSQEYDDFYHLYRASYDLMAMASALNSIHLAPLADKVRSALKDAQPHLLAYEDQVPSNPPTDKLMPMDKGPEDISF